MASGFMTDKQTFDDLRIFGKDRETSIYGLFNRTFTRGGALLLEEMFRYPLTNPEKINTRSAVFHDFMVRETEFPFRSEWFDVAEYYLRNTDERSCLTAGENTLQRKFRHCIGADTEYEQLHNGVLAIVGILNQVYAFLEKDGRHAENSPYREDAEVLRELTDDPELQWVQEEKETKRLGYEKMVEYDRVLRYEKNEKLKKLLHVIYRLDVYVSVAQVARKYGFTFGHALPAGENLLELEGIWHPLVPHAIPNTIRTDKNKRVIFLTGANMAGKSTFMKTFGIVVFLAHMGFPLPAKQVRFAVQSGLYTTINLPDNLNQGYSHFYAEVLRLKKVAQEMNRSGNLVIIFDELFRGTNVKDAYDATVAVTDAFSERRNCTFLISTHIIEAGEELQKRFRPVDYVYLPTEMRNGQPIYTYTLKPGITNDRHGMMIIRNEHILDILEQREKMTGEKPEYL